jgi:hypothetical protein
MTHNTPAREEAKELKLKAHDLTRESKALEGIEGAALLAGEREVEAVRLREMAREMQEKARLEDISVWKDCIVRETPRGEKKYERWLAGWRAEGGKIRKVYLGSCRKMNQEEAMQKAQRMKAKTLGGICQILPEKWQ